MLETKLNALLAFPYAPLVLQTLVLSICAQKQRATESLAARGLYRIAASRGRQWLAGRPRGRLSQRVALELGAPADLRRHRQRVFLALDERHEQLGDKANGNRLETDEHQQHAQHQER